MRRVPSIVGIRVQELRKNGPAGVAFAAIRLASYLLALEHI